MYGGKLSKSELKEQIDQLEKGALSQTIELQNGEKIIFGSIPVQTIELQAGPYSFRLGKFETQDASQSNKPTLFCEITANNQVAYLATQDKEDLFNKIVDQAADHQLIARKAVDSPLQTKGLIQDPEIKNSADRHEELYLQDQLGNTYRFSNDFYTNQFVNRIKEPNLGVYDIARFQIPSQTNEFLGAVLKVTEKDVLIMPISANIQNKRSSDILIPAKNHAFFTQDHILKGDRLMNVPIAWMKQSQGKLQPEVRSHLAKAALTKLKLWNFVQNMADVVAKKREAKQNKDQKHDHKHKTLTR